MYILKLLIAEDDPKLLKSLIHILETNKFSVDGVNNGDDALSYGLTGEIRWFDIRYYDAWNGWTKGSAVSPCK